MTLKDINLNELSALNSHCAGVTTECSRAKLVAYVCSLVFNSVANAIVSPSHDSRPRMLTLTNASRTSLS